MTEPGDATPQELGDSSRPDIADRVLAVNAHLVVSVVGPNEALVKHGSRSGFSMLLTDDDRSGLLAELLVSFREPTCLSALISNGVVAHGQVEAAEAFVSELLEADVLVDATVSSLDAYTELQFGPGASTRLVDSRVLVVGDGFVAGELLSDLTTLEHKSLEVIDIAGYTQPGPSAGRAPARCRSRSGDRCLSRGR